jgi:tetratricopeptide (TPR) repeat protein
MEHEHLDAQTLDELLSLDRTETQNRSLLHQIAVCPECHRVGGWLLDLHRAGALPPRFGLVDVALARSRAEAPALWNRLEREPPHEHRMRFVHSEPELASWGLAELLARHSERVAPEDSSRAVELAELAVSTAEAVSDDEPAEERWAYQLRAFAWSYLANARRVAGNLRDAQQAFEIADAWWSAGTNALGDVLGYEPAILDLKASLRIAQRRFEEALSLLDDVAEIYLHGDPEHRDDHLAGRTFIKKAHALVEKGETEQAISTVALALLYGPGTSDSWLLVVIDEPELAEWLENCVLKPVLVETRSRFRSDGDRDLAGYVGKVRQSRPSGEEAVPIGGEGQID